MLFFPAVFIRLLQRWYKSATRVWGEWPPYQAKTHGHTLPCVTQNPGQYQGVGMSKMQIHFLRSWRYFLNYIPQFCMHKYTDNRWSDFHSLARQFGDGGKGELESFKHTKVYLSYPNGACLSFQFFFFLFDRWKMHPTDSVKGVSFVKKEKRGGK